MRFLRCVGVAAAWAIIGAHGAIAAQPADDRSMSAAEAAELPAPAPIVGREGPGASTCGQFAASYRAYPQDTELLYFSWAQGYMSGMNTILEPLKVPPGDFGKKPIAEQQSIIRDFCDAHPLAPYEGAVLVLFEQLK